MARKFWQVFFGGKLDSSRDFLGYSKIMFLFLVLYHLMLSGNFIYGERCFSFGGGGGGSGGG